MRLKNAAFMASYAVPTIFLAVFTLQNDWKFLYIASIYILTAILHVTDIKVQLKPIAKFGYSIWLLMHMFGKRLKIGGTKLYGIMLMEIVRSPYNVIKYDPGSAFLLILNVHFNSVLYTSNNILQNQRIKIYHQVFFVHLFYRKSPSFFLTFSLQLFL